MLEGISESIYALNPLTKDYNAMLHVAMYQ